MIVTGTSRTVLALRGLLAVVVLLIAYALLFGKGTISFTSSPEVTAVVPASAGSLRLGSTVQYRGVVVGSVAAIDPGTAASDVTLAIDENSLEDIPSTTQVRLMPRNIFGDFFVDLIQPEGLAPGRPLTAGAQLAADQSEAAVQLYQAISRIYSLVSTLDPADINVALTAVSDAVSGKGQEIGRSLDAVHTAMVGAQPVIDHLGDDLDDISNLAHELSLSAPDLLGTLGNSITTSKTIAEKSDGVAAFLRAGTSSGSAAADVIGENRDRTITLINDSDTALGALTARPDQIGTVYRGLQNLVTKLPPAVANGPWLTTNLRLTIKDLYPYRKSACPQYDGLQGPNCPPAPAPLGGTVGPVGSPAEQAVISALTQGGTALDTLVAGPVLRGMTVVGE